MTFEKDFAHHPLHYFSLLCVMLIGLWGIFWFDHNSAVQLAIMVSLAISYVIWGVLHHLQHRDLHARIIFEYLLVAIFSILIFGSLLFRT